jgi:heme/copper-type cytochrome/quinol oxidase subunit 2
VRRGAEARRRVGAKTGGGAPARLRAWATILFALAMSESVLSACPVCFGGPTSISKGMDTAIFFLLAIVALVQIGFVALFWSFRRRAKELQRHREQFHLINGGAR